MLAALAATLALAGCGQKGQSAAGSNLVFVTNEFSGDLSVVDGSTGQVEGTYRLGKRPRGIKFSPDGRTVYVALSGSPVAPPGTDESKLPPPDPSADGIGMFDVGSRKLVGVIRGVANPEQLAVSRGGLIYAGSEAASGVVILDPQERKAVDTIMVGDEPEGVALSPDERFLYVAIEGENKVAVIDVAGRRVIARVPVGGRPRSIAFSPDGAKAYVTDEFQGAVTEMDGRTHQVLRTFMIPGAGAKPMGVVVSPDGSKVYVTTGRGGALVAIDAVSGAVSAPLGVGQRPWGVAISSDGKRLYTANGPSNDMTIVDAATMKVTGKVALGQRPWGVAAAPAN
ncbi:MAG TPA: lipoprotein [Caulobacteraceae bacterium]|nr:lipoprotein [Caulobacteraceae bacterium]